MGTRALAVIAAVLALVIAGSTVRAEIPPPATPTPAPSFIVTASAAPGDPAMWAPGCMLSGGAATWVLPDGVTTVTQLVQLNIVTPLPATCLQTPMPTPSATPIPTPAPTPAPTPTPAPVVTVVDDEAFTYFGTWTASVRTGPFGIGDHYSQTVGAAYGFLFTGTEVRLYAAVASHHGIATVSVDGGPAVDADFYSAIRIEQAPVFFSGPLPPGVHRIVIKVSGRKNAASTGTVVVADRANITDGTIIPPLAP